MYVCACVCVWAREIESHSPPFRSIQQGFWCITELCVYKSLIICGLIHFPQLHPFTHVRLSVCFSVILSSEAKHRCWSSQTHCWNHFTAQENSRDFCLNLSVSLSQFLSVSPLLGFSLSLIFILSLSLFNCRLLSNSTTLQSVSTTTTYRSCYIDQKADTVKETTHVVHSVNMYLI